MKLRKKLIFVAFTGEKKKLKPFRLEKKKELLKSLRRYLKQKLEKTKFNDKP